MAQPPPNRTPGKHPKQPTGVPVSSQRYLDVAQIRDGVVVLRDGSLRAVVLVNAVNFALKSEDEQNALIYAYQGFLNSFNFPIQILMQSRQLDLANYLKKLSDQLAETTNDLIQVQIIDYTQFIQRLIQIANIMDKKFYVIVPFTPPIIHQRGLIDKLFRPGERLEVKMSPAEFKAYRQELLERARIIMSGLGSMGLRSALLGTQETIELLYATYNPEEASKERLAQTETITGAYLHPSKTANSSGNQSTAAAPKPEVAPVIEPSQAAAQPPTLPDSSGAQVPPIQSVEVAADVGTQLPAAATQAEPAPAVPAVPPLVDSPIEPQSAAPAMTPPATISPTPTIESAPSPIDVPTALPSQPAIVEVAQSVTTLPAAENTPVAEPQPLGSTEPQPLDTPVADLPDTSAQPAPVAPNPAPLPSATPQVPPATSLPVQQPPETS
jgi:hypothetical protein